MIRNEEIISNIIKEAATVKVPKFEKDDDLAKWIKRQRPGSKFNDDIINPETGEVYFEKGQKLTKYQIQRLYGILTGRSYFDKKEVKTDPRDTFLLDNELNKYYKIIDKKNGNFVVYRSDNQPFKSYDENNLESILSNIEDENEQYEYEGKLKGFKEKSKYYMIGPKGINQDNVLKNFEEFYDVEYKKLGEWMEDEVFDEVKGIEYSEDTTVPHKIIKRDKSKITKDDEEIIEKWIKEKNKYLKRDDGIEMFMGSHSGNTTTYEPSFIR